ncbi:MAG: TetR/AcrR family transcriptional regulator [Actinomycetota bacterium]|nr:TetR/AcrR family transcriptional regulator [Actinomycetota bacterium]
MPVETAAQAPAPAQTATAGDRPLRADARRNRDAVLATAAAAFADHGVEASLEDIAKSAGVGIGTLYRHFPTREDLVYGVYRREVEQLSASAPVLAAELPPAQALREWMRRFVQYAATKRGLVGMLRSMMQTQAERFADLRTLVRDAAQMLLIAAADAGEIRGDISAEDLMRSMGGICMASDQSGPPENAERLVDLVFDGLRYGAPKAG